MELEIEKKMFVWIKIPCIDGVGSCDYDDACALLSSIKCPKELKKYGIPCHCPFQKVFDSLFRIISSLNDCKSY